MAKLITDGTRKAIKDMAYVSQCARTLSLLPSPEDFAMRLIGDMMIITRILNSISIRINEILDKYSSIPSEFLIAGFEETLKSIDDTSDYTKFAIKDTSDVMASNVGKKNQEIKDALGSAVSSNTSASLQIGGGLTYSSIAMGANIKLAMTGNGTRKVTNDAVEDSTNAKVNTDEKSDKVENKNKSEADETDTASDKDLTKKSVTKGTESIDGFFKNMGGGIDGAVDWIDNKNTGNKVVDGSKGALIEKVGNTKEEIEQKIERVKKVFKNLNKNFDNSFGFVNGNNFAGEHFSKYSNMTYTQMDSQMSYAVGEVKGATKDFIKNFNIGKVVTAIGGIVVGAGAATLAVDLLPHIDVDRMLKNVIGGVDTTRIDKMNELYKKKNFENEPDLLEVPDAPWRLSKDDLEKYNADGYNKYLEEFTEVNDNTRSEILGQMQKVKTISDIAIITEDNKEKMTANKSALKAMRKIRIDAIKAKQIERYKGFLSIELNYLKRDCLNMKNNIKNDWDIMMRQYKTAINEIKKFFTVDGYGGNETIDKCCNRINDDATQIVELCKSISIEMTNAVAMVPTPYSIGICSDMPVHKTLAFFKDIKIIITFLKNLIRLGIDIIANLTILAKLIFNGVQSLAKILKTLKDIIGVDKILDMIDNLVSLFRPKMMDAKILMENAISPIYYNETEDYEMKANALEALLADDKDGGSIDEFKYTDDPYARKKYRDKDHTYGGNMKTDDEIEDALEELEAKGEREIVAYRSPILNAEGDDFAGWIFYYAYAYDNMKKSWRSSKKRRKNKLIKKASKKNKMRRGKLIGGVAQLKKNRSFGYTDGNGRFHKNTITGFDAYYWYTKWTNDPTDCDADFSNAEPTYDDEGNLIGVKAINKNVISPIQTTANGSLVELNNGQRVFVEGKIVKSGDYVNVNGVKYKVK